MFGSGDFGDKSPSWFLEILKLPLFFSSNLKIFKNALGQFILNCPPKHVITSTNHRIITIILLLRLTSLQLANGLKEIIFQLSQLYLNPYRLKLIFLGFYSRGTNLVYQEPRLNLFFCLNYSWVSDSSLMGNIQFVLILFVSDCDKENKIL